MSNSFEQVPSNQAERKDAGVSDEMRREYTQQQYNRTRIEDFLSKPNWESGDKGPIASMAQLAKETELSMTKYSLAIDINDREWDLVQKDIHRVHEAFNKLEKAQESK